MTGRGKKTTRLVGCDSSHIYSHYLKTGYQKYQKEKVEGTQAAKRRWNERRPESTAAGMRHTNTWMLFYAWGPAPAPQGKEEGLRTGKELRRGRRCGEREKPGEVLPREMEKGDRPYCLSTDLRLRVVPPSCGIV